MYESEFKKIRKEIDIDNQTTIAIEEKIKELWYELQRNWDEENWNYLIDIAHYSRFMRSNPNTQANLAQYSYWKNVIHNWTNWNISY